MQVKISFRGMSSSPSLEALIHLWASRLRGVYDRIQRCEVVVEAPPLRRRHGNPCRVRVALTVPGGRLDVKHEHATDDPSTDVYLAVRDALRAARRRLEDHVHRVFHDNERVAARG